MKNIVDLAVQVPQILLPRKGTDLTRWAVVACDQFTSEPDYWNRVKKFVGKSPSTLNLILPEIYLGKRGEAARVGKIHGQMRSYLDDHLFDSHTGMVYVERNVNGKTRHGLMLALDLEHYDYNRGSTSLIRATEGTIVERLPPRMKIRSGADLELPHIMVLIDDPQQSVIEPLTRARINLEILYGFNLMMGSGHLAGYAVSPDLESGILAALRKLADPQLFAKKYSLHSQLSMLLFAMGDGNHSLAAAKAVWERMKPSVGMEHPARHALVEVVNLHDPALVFEPIHRVLFGLENDLAASLKSFFGSRILFHSYKESAALVKAVDEARSTGHLIGMVEAGEKFTLLEISSPPSNLPVGTLQEFLDSFLQNGKVKKIDYIHGTHTVFSLGAQDGNAGFYLAPMHKTDLFKTVILDGALPRKTFSMGEAHEKRFYMEARKIV